MGAPGRALEQFVMALILAADTSTSVNTVGLCMTVSRDEVCVRCETTMECARGHAERLIETVDWVLRQGGATLGDVDMLAISAGPGSFTGLRIGVATFKGLAFACEKPLYAVPTLDALARAPGLHEGTLCPLIDARMGEVYGAVFDFRDGRREVRIPAQVGTVASLLAPVEGLVHFTGDGAARYRAGIEALLPRAVFAPAWRSLPSAASVAAEAWALAASGGASCDADAIAPVYLRQAKVDLRGLVGAHGA